MIFGWPIDGRITEAAGIIKFSVRFLLWDKQDEKDPKITFSLSTLTAQAIVNPGLDFEATELVASDEYNLMIANRLKETQITGSSTPDVPTFLLGLEEVEMNLGEDGTVTLLVQAYAPDAGAITYAWKKNDLEGADISQENGANTVYIETEDSVAKESKTYYLKTTIDEITSYTVITDLSLGEDIEQYEKDHHGGTVCERFGKLTVTSVGKYYAIAKNRVNAMTATASTGPITVPGPIASEINLISDDFIMDADNGYKITLTPTVDNPTATELQYQWLKDGKEIENANTISYTIEGDGVTASKQGNFALQVTAFRNKAEITNTSKEYFVTYPPAIPIITDNTNGLQAINCGDIVSVSVDFENDYQINHTPEDITYQWYRRTNSGEQILSGATEASYQTSASQAGISIFCRVINHYNGQASEPVNSANISIVNMDE